MEVMKKAKTVVGIVLIVAAWTSAGFSQQPYRQGTTAANFLEIGFGSAGCAMGDAYVSVANDMSAVFWNPAGLAYMENSEVMFNYQPWLVDMNAMFVGAGLTFPRVGTFALSLIQMGYGSMEVTTLDMQDGTGEQFDANDMAVGLSYGKRLVQWFSFGATAKYISSQIWHMRASAFALDLGVMIKTRFFSPTGNREDGLNIGMSISNFGTRMRYNGIDLLNPIDILPYEQGNYGDVPGQFRLEGWELPLIFRIGFSIHPLVTRSHRMTLSCDALHPNNNTESVNIGGQYEFTIPNGGTFFLRGGYKALFMEDSEFGFTFGGGFILRMMQNTGLKVEYAYRGMGLLGEIHSYSFGILF
jgi:hypothetical protein